MAHKFRTRSIFAKSGSFKDSLFVGSDLPAQTTSGLIVSGVDFIVADGNVFFDNPPRVSGSEVLFGDISLGDLSNVDLQNYPPFVGDYLRWDGMNWVSAASIEEHISGDLIVEIGRAFAAEADISGTLRSDLIDIGNQTLSNTYDISGLGASLVSFHEQMADEFSGVYYQLGESALASIELFTAAESARNLYVQYHYEISHVPTAIVSASSYLGQSTGSYAIVDTNLWDLGNGGKIVSDPTMTGLTFDSTNGIWNGFEPGTYEIDVNFFIKYEPAGTVVTEMSHFIEFDGGNGFTNINEDVAMKFPSSIVGSNTMTHTVNISSLYTFTGIDSANKGRHQGREGPPYAQERVSVI